ncbi:hypothetical protein ATN84_12340 [Paramesorhizobium deserti]|uniref:SPW repeat-containing integral membrane domain-containing protein n=1 Tax=Paramesorhizobium deserti TaxID=1494590 RepID=A0A135HUE4_9HYPH|nr:SPW repeat protein [Paramesorhizobium deserti]KXF76800.1 hypothetical protein ATN84_12340 [Paramesorhizobium deserti]
MATTNDMGRIGLMQHRSWEDMAMMALGAIIFLSPFFYPMSGNIAIVLSAIITGAVVMTVGIMEMVSLRRWEEMLAFLGGVWMVIAPYALNYMGPLRVWHIALGIIVALLAAFQMWQDRDRRFDE